MRTTLNIDDDLLAKATELSGISERSAVLREGLKALIERESAKRLARLGGSEPNLAVSPRRKSDLTTADNA
jgi:Arc/MetJ family transcription regulator